ncbi:MAG: DUF3465 domain-containing protein [Pseudomonadota bacterium]
MTKKWLRLIALVFVAGGVWLAQQAGYSLTPGAPLPIETTDDGAERLADAFDQQLFDEWLTGRGRVVRLLSDDNEGSRHQRFVIETTTGQSLLVAHNIDLAPRVPVGMGDTVQFKGVYEWNERGGVIHWTHHDPQDRQPGGYIELAGTRYE